MGSLGTKRNLASVMINAQTLAGAKWSKEKQYPHKRDLVSQGKIATYLCISYQLHLIYTIHTQIACFYCTAGDIWQYMIDLQS